MIISLKTESGVEVREPTEKFVVALLVAMADEEPERFKHVMELADGVALGELLDKLVMAILVTTANNPILFAKMLHLVDTKIDAYAAVPESVQRALRSNIRA